MPNGCGLILKNQYFLEFPSLRSFLDGDRECSKIRVLRLFLTITQQVNCYFVHFIKAYYENLPIYIEKNFLQKSCYKISHETLYIIEGFNHPLLSIIRWPYPLPEHVFFKCRQDIRILLSWWHSSSYLICPSSAIRSAVIIQPSESNAYACPSIWLTISCRYV